MNIREREIIRRLRSDNERERSRQVDDLFYGDGEETRELKELFKKVVKICYGGPRYGGMQREIYDTLVSLVCSAIREASDSTIEGIRDLRGYFFQMARNCANSKRGFIHGCLGINERDQSLDAEGVRPPVGEDPDADEGLDFLIILLHGDPDVDTGGKTRGDLARELVERYIGRIPCETYRKVLYAVDIWGWTHERIERELGITHINQNHRRAKLSLTKAALPDIRKTCAVFFRNHRDCVSSGEAALLERFFNGEAGAPDSAVSKAFVKLVKVAARNRTAFLMEMKRMAREEKKRTKN